MYHKNRNRDVIKFLTCHVSVTEKKEFVYIPLFLKTFCGSRFTDKKYQPEK